MKHFRLALALLCLLFMATGACADVVFLTDPGSTEAQLQYSLLDVQNAAIDASNYTQDAPTDGILSYDIHGIDLANADNIALQLAFDARPNQTVAYPAQLLEEHLYAYRIQTEGMPENLAYYITLASIEPNAQNTYTPYSAVGFTQSGGFLTDEDAYVLPGPGALRIQIYTNDLTGELVDESSMPIVFDTAVDFNDTEIGSTAVFPARVISGDELLVTLKVTKEYQLR